MSILLFFGVAWLVLDLLGVFRVKGAVKRQDAVNKDLQRRQDEAEKEQARLAKEQERQAKEQTRQAEQLAKHEKRLADLEYKARQAEADIAHWEETCNSLFALLDIEQAEDAAAVPGSKTQIKCQKRIIALNNQIHSAEARIAKAKHIKEMAEKELAS